MGDLQKYESEEIRLTADGKWYHGDTEITHERTLDLFFKNIVRENDAFFLTGEKVPVPVTVDDTAYFVRSISRVTPLGYELQLSDGSRERLDVGTLDIGDENQLYCKIKNHGTRARFDRKAYNKLMQDLDEKEGFYGLVRDGMFYPIRRKDVPIVGYQEPSDPADFVPAVKPASKPRQRTLLLAVKSQAAKKPQQPAARKKVVAKPVKKAMKKSVAKTVKKSVKKKTARTSVSKSKSKKRS